MGLLDKGFDLPGVVSTLGTAVSSGVTRLTEAVSTTFQTMGSTAGPFSKLGANTPSIESIKAVALKESAGALSVDQIRAGNIQDLGAKYGMDLSVTSGGDVSASSVKAAGAKAVSTDHMVSLTDGVKTVWFDVMPEIVENHQADYEAVAPAQAPGAFQKYKGTQSTTWVLNITLISRNSAEATKNFLYLCTLRGWTMPYFGVSTGQKFPKKLGAPPPVLKLHGLRGLIGTVPVVITSLNWNWPKDVDYLPTSIPGEDGNFIPFPAVMQLPINMVESYSTTQFNQFDLEAYRAGDMKGAFGVPVDRANEDFDTRRHAAVDVPTQSEPEVDRLNENYDQRLVARQELYGESIRGVVTQAGTTFSNLGPRLAMSHAAKVAAGERMLAEASARNAKEKTSFDRPRGGR